MFVLTLLEFTLWSVNLFLLFEFIFFLYQFKFASQTISQLKNHSQNKFVSESAKTKASKSSLLLNQIHSSLFKVCLKENSNYHLGLFLILPILSFLVSSIKSYCQNLHFHLHLVIYSLFTIQFTLITTVTLDFILLLDFLILLILFPPNHP